MPVYSASKTIILKNRKAYFHPVPPPVLFLHASFSCPLDILLYKYHKVAIFLLFYPEKEIALRALSGLFAFPLVPGCDFLGIPAHPPSVFSAVESVKPLFTYRRTSGICTILIFPAVHFHHHISPFGVTDSKEFIDVYLLQPCRFTDFFFHPLSRLCISARGTRQSHAPEASPVQT